MKEVYSVGNFLRGCRAAANQWIRSGEGFLIIAEAILLGICGLLVFLLASLLLTEGQRLLQVLSLLKPTEAWSLGIAAVTMVTGLGFYGVIRWRGLRDGAKNLCELGSRSRPSSSGGDLAEEGATEAAS